MPKTTSPGRRSPRRRRLLVVVAVVGGSLSLFPRGSAATVEEQRARLPPPAECPDRVEGTWSAQYYTTGKVWSAYTIVVRRTGPAVDGNAAGPIEVEMKAHTWDGGPQEDTPPSCRRNQREVTFKMPGKGSIDAAGAVDFGATTYSVESIVCGNDTIYYPDHFKGRIDSSIQEFQSVNNDGVAAINEPVVFRRVRCLGAPARGTTTAKPPAFAPPKRSFGCSF